MPVAQPKLSYNFGDISLAKAIFGKYLKESYSSELNLQLSLKYFVNLYFIPKLFCKRVIGADNIGQVDIQA